MSYVWSMFIVHDFVNLGLQYIYCCNRSSSVLNFEGIWQGWDVKPESYNQRKFVSFISLPGLLDIITKMLLTASCFYPVVTDHGQSMRLHESWPIHGCYQGEVRQVCWCTWARIPLRTLVPRKQGGWSSLSSGAAVGCSLRDQDKGSSPFPTAIKILSLSHTKYRFIF